MPFQDTWPQLFMSLYLGYTYTYVHTYIHTHIWTAHLNLEGSLSYMLQKWSKPKNASRIWSRKRSNTEWGRLYERSRNRGLEGSTVWKRRAWQEKNMWRAKGRDKPMCSHLRDFAHAVPSAWDYFPASGSPPRFFQVFTQKRPSQWGLPCLPYLKFQPLPSPVVSLPFPALDFLFSTYRYLIYFIF